MFCLNSPVRSVQPSSISSRLFRLYYILFHSVPALSIGPLNILSVFLNLCTIFALTLSIACLQQLTPTNFSTEYLWHLGPMCPNFPVEWSLREVQWIKMLSSADDPQMTLTYFKSRSNLLPNAFIWECFGKVDF